MRTRIATLLVLLVVGFGLYAHTLNNAFVFDDEEQIVNSALVHDLGRIAEAFSGSTMNEGGASRMGGIYYKPLMTASYMLNWHFFGEWPVPYRVLQILIHIFNAFFFFLLLRPVAGFFWSGFVALIFLVHPQNTEAAIYLADLQDVLFTFFGLASLLFLRRFSRQSPGRDQPRSLIPLVGATLCLLFSALSKETAAAFFALALLYPLVFRQVKKSFLWVSGAVFVSAGIYALMRFGWADLSRVNHGVALIARATWGERFLTAPKALVYYLTHFFYPVDLTTTQNWVVPQATVADFWLPLIALLMLAGIVGFYGRRWARTTSADSRHWAAFFSLWFLGGLVIHSHLLAPLDGTVADRWFYFPMLGLLGLFAVFVSSWKPQRHIQKALVLLPLLPLAALAHTRGSNWKDGMTLYRHDVRIAPDSYDIQNNYGVELFRHGHYDLALKHFQKSVELAPHWTINWNNLGAAYEKMQNFTAAEKAYCRSIQNGVYYVAFENYPNLLIRMGRLNEAYDFISNIGLRALPLNPKLQQMQSILADPAEGAPTPNPDYQLRCP